NTLLLISLFLFHTPSTTDIYTLSLHDALPISAETPKLGCPVQAEGPSTKVDGPLHRSKFSFSVLRGVNHRDIRINLHRLAIENCRSVAPLADRFPRRKIEKRIAGNNLQGLNRAV